MYISASAPDAPPFSETTIGCFIKLFFWIAACIIRAIWSEAPPAPAATTISTGLVGSQAIAGTLDVAIAKQTAAVCTTLRMYSSLLFWPALTPGVLLTADKKLRADQFEMRRRIGFRPLFEIGHRSFDTAGAVRHARSGKAHLHARQGSDQGKFIALAEMADAKHFTCEFAQAGAERHIVVIQHRLAEFVRVMARRHQDGGQYR